LPPKFSIATPAPARVPERSRTRRVRNTLSSPLRMRWSSGIWPSRGLSGMAADQARQFDSVALAAPDRLVIRFKSGYAVCKSACQRPEQVARFEQALAEVCGQRIRVEFDLGGGRSRSDGSRVGSGTGRFTPPAAAGRDETSASASGGRICSAPSRCESTINRQDNDIDALSSGNGCHHAPVTLEFSDRVSTDLKLRRPVEASPADRRPDGQITEKCANSGSPALAAAGWSRSKSTA